MSGRVVVVRHGEPDYEAVRPIGVDSSARNVAPLTPAGVEQARQRGRDLREFDVRSIVSSPMTRTFQTAVLIAQELLLDVNLDVGLREWGSGTNGTEEAFAAATIQYRAAQGQHMGGELWESRDQLRARAAAVVSLWRGAERDLVVVTHAFVFEALTGRDGRDIGYCDIAVLP